MTYTDSAFLFVLFPIAIILYNLMPKKGRGITLLALSYAFFFVMTDKKIYQRMMAAKLLNLRDTNKGMHTKRNM